MTAKARLQIRTYLRSQEKNQSHALGLRWLSHALGSTKIEDIPTEKVQQGIPSMSPGLDSHLNFRPEFKTKYPI